MRFFIVDDDPAVRYMLAEIIEDEDLGELAGEEDDGANINADLLNLKKVDILLIDLLMPKRDGIETLRQLSADYEGRAVMLSQIESKDMIAEAYSLGIEYYITKPINRLEVINIIQRVIERVEMQKSIQLIQSSLSNISHRKIRDRQDVPFAQKSIDSSGKFLLTELGIMGESGGKDLLDILSFLHSSEKGSSIDHDFPPLKDILLNLAKVRRGSVSSAINQEVKACEQRIRRTIFQALTHIASLGLTDFSNPKFENYASTFFDFKEVRKVMMALEEHADPSHANVRISMKKFIYILYMESKRLLAS
ncbi:response regulator [Ammoniphilus sp. 3BR4]|uniref:response regulator n=1 Tax=Ammoniphilus sp. 3BR4 TaxID=3158265 RepID=UPI003464F465